jgi:hypothetical protein
MILITILPPDENSNSLFVLYPIRVVPVAVDSLVPVALDS